MTGLLHRLGSRHRR